MTEDRLPLLYSILDQFSIYGDFETAAPFGTGHINSTFMSRWNQSGTRIRYLHQRINENVFIHPDHVMDNIERVTTHIIAKLKELKVPEVSRRTLTVVPSLDGKPYVRDIEGGWWRTYLFIEGTHTLELARSPKEAAFLGETIGRFQKQLADLPAPRLYETIANFHNMEWRYQRFYEALSKDPLKRVGDVQEEITFMKDNEERGAVLIRALRSGFIPERICHNDTKMNNILIDDSSDEGLCVGDLDTVMPGTSLFDVGDLIRTVTTRAEEDETDLFKVEFDLNYLKALLDGYLSEASEFLTSSEKDLLLESGRCITQIMGIRFLTDYLEGDHYYRISRPRHNLDRCRNQIALMKSMDSKWDSASDITANLFVRHGKN